MWLHQSFQWRDEKAEINLQKHGVSFDVASEVLGDPFAARFHWERFDETHSQGEDRWVTVGSHPERRQLLIVIVWTRRAAATRTISARPATRRERIEYEQHIRRRRG